MTKDNSNGSPVCKSSKKVWLIVLSIVIIALVLSASLNVYYYNRSKTEESSINGAAFEVARRFRLCTWQISYTLNTDLTSNDVGDLLQPLQYHLDTAWSMIRVLRNYVLPEYSIQMQTIEDLLENMTVGENGTWATLDNLRFTNRTLLLQAFEELNTNASQRTVDMGNAVGLAFWTRQSGSDGTVVELRVDSSKIENAVTICNDLKAILNTWETKYPIL